MWQVGLGSEDPVLHPLLLIGQQWCHCVTRDVVQALWQSCSSANGKLDLKSLERMRHIQAKAEHQISPKREAVSAIGTEKRTTGVGLRLLKYTMIVSFHLGVRLTCPS